MKYIVKKLELALLNPKIRKSKNKLAELLADDFLEFAQSGKIHTKQDIINKLPQAPTEKFSPHDYTEKQLSPELVLVRYTVDRRVIKSGLKRRTLCSSIWHKQKGQWRMIFFQGTPTAKKHS
ncbi:nuclear transport factor 2 family protein [Candidatus Kuenenbacteria bacterium]|nr:nuclear transport factor 2 family protein [Candidatus Kuenenbacteria bacterium]